MSSQDRLNMALGEAIFSMRAIRQFKPDPIPEQALNDILLAATQAPSGGNLQPWHFVVVQDQQKKSEFAKLYREAWWSKRRDIGIESPDQIAKGDKVSQSAMKLADSIAEAPVIILVCATVKFPQAETFVIPATQNLLLAARALDIGGTITTLHANVEASVKQLFEIPEAAQVVYCVPLGYPKGNFGPLNRKPLDEVVSEDSWGQVPDWL
jgi:nitroreductase